MHELVIAQDIVGAVLAEARRRKATAVRTIDLEIGELEGLREHDLRRAFEIEAAGTLVHGARLRITVIPATATCRACGTSTKVEPPSGRIHRPAALTCKACGSELAIENGRGFVVRSAKLILEETKAA